jgi:hypothetical protein
MVLYIECNFLVQFDWYNSLVISWYNIIRVETKEIKRVTGTILLLSGPEFNWYNSTIAHP